MRMAENLERIIAIEALCAAQGVGFRAPLTTSPALQLMVARLRQDVPALEDDRYLAPELETARDLVASGALIAALGVGLPELGA
jgi:histidine ammonia-lyase